MCQLDARGPLVEVAPPARPPGPAAGVRAGRAGPRERVVPPRRAAQMEVVAQRGVRWVLIDFAMGMELLTVDRDVPLRRSGVEERAAAECAAREALRGQVAKLERELSTIVAGGFPHIYAVPAPAWVGCVGSSSADARRARAPARPARAAGARGAGAGGSTGELQWRAQERLERMKQEPGRYKFVRLPVVDLGERGCGVWEVRPRLGLIGMLAGWWQLKLSSGCPLPGGPRGCAAPALGGRARGGRA